LDNPQCECCVLCYAIGANDGQTAGAGHERDEVVRYLRAQAERSQGSTSIALRAAANAIEAEAQHRAEPGKEPWR
jgi:hypothetical protein